MNFRVVTTVLGLRIHYEVLKLISSLALLSKNITLPYCSGQPVTIKDIRVLVNALSLGGCR